MDRDGAPALALHPGAAWHAVVVEAAVPALLDAHRAGRPGHLVRVAALSGFGLRDRGEGGVVVDGAVVGRLLAGLADDDLVRAAGEGRRVLRSSISDRSADDAGLVCGGVATLSLTPLADLPDELFGWLAEARPVALATSLGDDVDEGGAALAVTERHQAGSLGAAPLDEAAVTRCRELLAGGQGDTRTEEVDGRSLLISVVAPRTRVLLVGSGPMAAAIAAQLALLDWSCQPTEQTADALEFLAGAGPADAVVVLSHDPELDTTVLAHALDSGVGYVGAMGSRATQTGRRNRLTQRGYDREHLARIHGPIGLDLGTRSPAETAVAIVAEILAARSGRVAGSLRAAAGPING